MGFLKKLFPYILLLFFIGGCSSSLIKLDIEPGYTGLEMFGQKSERSFYYDIEKIDTLKLKWSSSTKGSFTNNTVVTAEKFVFINDLAGRITVFDIETGKRKGMLNYKGSVYTTPVINKYTTYFAVAELNNPSSLLVGYDIFNGVELFKVEIEGKIVNELLFLDDGIIAITGNGDVFKYGFKGEKIFQIRLRKGINSHPTLYKEQVVFGTKEGEILILDKNNGQVKRKVKISDQSLNNGSIKNNIFYIGSDDGNLYSYNFETGKEKILFKTGSKIIAAPSFDNENIYFGSMAGWFYSFSLKKEKMNWSINLNGLINASAMVTKDEVVIPDLNKNIYIVNKRTGGINSVYKYEGRVKLTPVVKDNLLFIGYDNGVLECYEIQ